MKCNPLFRRYTDFSDRGDLHKLSKCTALVIWGKNLPSTVGVKFSRAQLASVSLPLFVRDVIVGILLSDAWLNFSNPRSKNARLGFMQTYSHSGYFWFVFLILSHYCYSYAVYRERVRFGKNLYSLSFCTRSLPCITEFIFKFYKGREKIIPEDIYNMLTPVALAHIIMGDGTRDHGWGIILCTDAYSLQDIIRLMNVLIIRYKLDCTIRKHGQYNRIYIRQRSMPLLRSIVTPHFHSSMLYKVL